MKAKGLRLARPMDHMEPDMDQMGGPSDADMDNMGYGGQNEMPMTGYESGTPRTVGKPSYTADGEFEQWKQEVEMDRQDNLDVIKRSRKDYDKWDMSWRRKGVEAGFDQQEIDSYMDSLWEMDDGQEYDDMNTSDY